MLYEYFYFLTKFIYIIHDDFLWQLFDRAHNILILNQRKTNIIKEKKKRMKLMKLSCT